MPSSATSLYSPDVATTRHVVDSYLETRNTRRRAAVQELHPLAAAPGAGAGLHFTEFDGEVTGIGYNDPAAPIDEQTRAFLTRLSIVAQPVTYSLSNEGFGPLHELHVPKNLVLMLIAGTAAGGKPASRNPQRPQKL